MKNIRAILAASFIAILLASCSRGNHSVDENASAESVYDSGASVSAMGFSDAASIELFSLSGGNSVALHDGDSTEPGIKTIGVAVEAEPSTIDRVFLTNGGLYQVEAVKQGAMYTCDFLISETSLYQTILVQAIHSNKRASKEKIILRVNKSTPEGGYMKNGVGLVVGQSILDGQKEDMADLLDEKIKNVFNYITQERPDVISQLRYGDNIDSTRDIEVTILEAATTENYPEAALRIQFVIKNVSFSAMPLFNTNLIHTQSNDLIFDAYVSIEDNGSMGDVLLVIDFLGSAQVSFAKSFFMQSTAERMISSELARVELAPAAFYLKDKAEAMRETLPESLEINGSEVDVSKLLEGLDLNLRKYLFADITSLLGGSSSGLLALNLGLIIEDEEIVQWETVASPAPSVPIDAEGVFVDLCEQAVGDMLNNLKQKYKSSITTLSYGDNDSTTDDFVVNSFSLQNTDIPEMKNLHMNFTLKKVDLRAGISLFGLSGISVISTDDNDLIIDAVFSIENYDDDGESKIYFDILSVNYARFQKSFSWKSLVEDLIERDLAEMEKVSRDTNEILDGISLDIDLSEASSAEGEDLLFPERTYFIDSPGWVNGLKDTYNIRCALSQYNINRVLQEVIGKDLEWDVKELLIPILGKKFPAFSAERSNAEQTVMRFSVPPVIDLKSSQIRLLIPGIIIEYRLSGIPQWEASIDLDLIITPSVQGKKLNISISPVEGQNYFHIMKDNRGNLGIFDHSSLAEDVIKELPEMLDRSPGEPLLSYSLDAWEPSIVLREREDPMVLTSGGCYLTIDMAASSVDLSEWREILGN